MMTLRLRLNDDRTSALVDCSPDFPDLEQIIATLRESLEALGIDDPIGQAAAEYAFRAAVERGPLDSVPILEGRHPTAPRDEKMAWSRQYFEPGFHVDPDTGAVDYRRRAAESSVTAGELLGTVIPGEAGLPGRNLFGDIVPPRAVERVKIRPGKGVRFEESERAFYAEVSGQAKLASNVLSVDTVVTVAGSVGLKTGNIRHPGALLVEENIEAGSEVVAAGNIEVRGYIEDAIVSAGGRVIVHGGIMGERTLVRSRGEIHAKYVLNARIEAEQDICVEREIDNATVCTRGRLVMPNGRLVGGNCMALGGVTVKEAGSGSGLATRISAGEDFALKRKLAVRQERINHLRALLTGIQKKVEPLAQHVDRLNMQGQNNLSILLSKLADAEQKMNALQEEVKALREASSARARNEVIVQNHLHSDTIFHVAGLVLRNDQEVPGPIKIAVADGELHLIAVTRR
jgi:uncharacterized protein (DUF342 family)